MRRLIALLALALSAQAAQAQIPPVEVEAPAYPRAQMERAEGLLRRGDVSAARKALEFSASRGVAAAATLLGRTYDPATLDSMGIRGGIAGDPKEAARWYQRGADLGDPDARRLLETLTARR